jgi:hypothetical protein
LSRLAQLGQAEFQAEVEKLFLAGSNPALRITKNQMRGDGENG